MTVSFQASLLQLEDTHIPEETAGLLSPLGLLSVIFLVLVGSGMQGYANGTIGAFFMALFFLIAGITGVGLVFSGRKPELRAFLLTYTLCLFTGGLAQCYSLAAFGNPQSTGDASLFLRFISPGPPFTTMANMPPINSPLAVLIWQQAYKLSWLLGFDFGPYTGVLFNALVMGLTGSIAVQTGRELFGDDLWRLRRIGTLFASCGLFLLFGSILLRDCFTTFLNTLVLWVLIRWLVESTVRNFFLALAVTSISAYAMAFLRLQAVVMFGFIWFIALFFWFLRVRLNPVRLSVILIIVSVLLMGYPYLGDYIEYARMFQFERAETYMMFSTTESSSGSLGLRLIINQPMPIRLVLGSGSLLVFPLPLWTYLQRGVIDYLLIKTYHGVYQVLVLPLVFVGSLMIVRDSLKNLHQSIPLLFVAVCLLMTLLSVVATSLEQRHLAQFMVAFIILAAIPDTRDKNTQTLLWTISKAWGLVVILMHLAWAVAK